MPLTRFVFGSIELYLVQPVLHDWHNEGRGMSDLVCGVLHIKETLLLIANLSRIEEQALACACARDRRALQQLALNVHVKHSDLT